MRPWGDGDPFAHVPEDLASRARGSPALSAFVSVARELVAEWKQEAR